MMVRLVEPSEPTVTARCTSPDCPWQQHGTDPGTVRRFARLHTGGRTGHTTEVTETAVWRYELE